MYKKIDPVYEWKWKWKRERLIKVQDKYITSQILTETSNRSTRDNLEVYTIICACWAI